MKTNKKDNKIPKFRLGVVTIGGPRAACGKFMLRLAKYKNEKKSKKNQIEGKGPEKPKKRRKLEEFCSRKQKSRKTDLGLRVGP